MNVHPLINENGEEHQHQVKIAILDTGIYATHPQIRDALQKGNIKKYKGFPEALEPLRDGHGHGTHCTSVLLRTAPNASLYIARVADDNGKLSSDDNYFHITQAIEWTIEEGVNVISISWGTNETIPSMTAAINKAIKAGILVFAAASNSRANYPVTFPARMKDVFCIGSVDGSGSLSSFSPPFVGEENYNILGEGVLGACIPKFASEPGYKSATQMVRRDGTSAAAPIAAGIAALLTEYARQFINYDGTYENTRKLFIAMSEASKGKDYRYITPTSLFENGNQTKERIKDILSPPPGMRPC